METKFVRLYDSNDQLYEADARPGRLLLIIPGGYGQLAIGLAEAWTSSGLGGIFAYARGDTGITEATAGDFVAAVRARVAQAKVARGHVWLTEPAAWQAGGLTAANAPLLGLSPDGSSASQALTALVVSDVYLVVVGGSQLTLDVTNVRITGGLYLKGTHSPAGTYPQTGELSCGDGSLGLLTFAAGLTRGSLLANACWGFQYAHPAQDGSPVHEWMALASDAPATTGQIGFTVAMDPSDPVNRYSRPAPRSQLVFTGLDGDGTRTALASPFVTRQGAPVTLYPSPAAKQPAALVFNPGTGAAGRGGQMQLSPVGDFELSAAQDPADLMCGLLGTEVVSVYRGDLLRFTPYRPAYAPRFPFPDASPLRAPVEAAPALLDERYTTSWASVVSGRGQPVPYIAQPKGAAFFGTGDPIWNPDSGLMGWTRTADPVPEEAAFPLAPYPAAAGLTDGAFTPARRADFEREVLGPVRRSHIPATASAGPGTADGTYTTVTPSGLLVTVKGGTWTQITLGQTTAPPLGLYFCNPKPTVRQAFQTADLMLVAADATQFGKLIRGSGICVDAEAAFASTVDIGGWELSANVGQGNQYADYRNVMLIKGRKGRLYDPADVASSMVANPERWTAPADFSVPSGEPDELVVLAQWLKDYFQAALDSEDPDLAGFNQIAADENWTGILILRADIKVPDDLVGITAGVADPDGFHAHHLGVEITPVSVEQGAGPGVTGASSMFGLIDYTDPDFIAPEPVRPAPGRPYDFRLLSLKVVFANTAVSSFRSHAQLTATEWFGTRVARMGGGGNPYRAIVLEGTLQTDDGHPVYSMSASTDTIFYFDHDVLAKLEVTGAVMSTRATGREQDTADPEPMARSWFGLTGFLDFKAPRVVDETLPGGGYNFDVYSFGSLPDEADVPRRGLAFSDLGIAMTFPPDNPAGNVLVLEAGETCFDVATSTARPGSLFRQFALDVAGLRSGTARTPPSESGYSQVVTAARLTGVDGEPWWGVDYRLPLGTPGNLAGRTALTAHLLTAWAANPRRQPRDLPTRQTARAYRAAVALSLPGSEGGAKLISLQNVLKLSVGQIRLLYDPGRGSYLLLLSEIALKLFGMMSVPPGSTLFSLYGDQDGEHPGEQAGGNPSGLGWYAMYRKSSGGAA